MSSTPGKPRHSGAGKSSGIPTPGRSRASSTVIQQNTLQADGEYMSRAFAEAIKANDPAQHRAVSANGASSTRSSSGAGILSGRRSVAGRPSSVASATNVQPTVLLPERARTPVSAQPLGRHSDAFAKNAARQFVVGDQVRMESLGFEGTLRFMGEIDGKPGLWAGVELSGGFAGLGKNNGTADGVPYFSCAEKCGVFIAAFKLSSPTVGVGSAIRPSSVASSRGGRVTPAFSGRLTPSSSSALSGRASASSSLSNGRVTPSTSGRVTPLSSGRITPGVTPAARSRIALGKSTTSILEKNPPTGQFSAGSRASKLMSMTAKQLSSRDASSSPSRRALESPTRAHSSPSSRPLGTVSPTHVLGSPATTPKSGVASRASGLSGGLPTPNKSRSSLSTPRPRIPSAVSMPPPASPASIRTISLNSHLSGTSIDEPERDLPTLKDTHESFLYDSFSASSSFRSDSISSIQSLTTGGQALVDQLQSRINALEYDNERLRLATHIPVPSTDELTQLQSARRERDEALNKITILETALNTTKDDMESQQIRLASLEKEKWEVTNTLEVQMLSAENDLNALQEKLGNEKSLVQELRDAIDSQERAFKQKELLVTTKEETISSLQFELAAASAELRDEQLELGTQIEKLRTAGQETIALYEERLSTADSQRYDLEQRIITLETRLQNAQKTLSPPPVTSSESSAAEIDNQTLRDQILHLQRKISTMEETMEDMQAVAERDEAAMRERIHRLREKEDVMRKELNEGRKEVERTLKSESITRTRVEEIEEALRESTFALENARAEVEGLRAELANLDSLVANSTGGDLYSRVAEAAQSTAKDKARYTAEITQLNNALEQNRASERSNANGISDVRISQLVEEKALLQEQLDDQMTKLHALSESLDSASKELENMKKNNKDVAVVNHDMPRPLPPSPSPKHDLSAAREEITGLKHIVQELQKENLGATQRIKMLESENQLLSSEASQLRQEVQILEENLDNGLDPEERVADSSRDVVDDSPRKLREQKSHLETEQDQLRKRLVDGEMKSARTIHDLNKEISELEALIESKIYREDELEQEVERLREKLSRHDKKRPKNSTDTLEGIKKTGGGAEQVCEICEQPGHDIFNCDVLNKDTLVKEMFCEDCESHGHTSADCPHSLDVF